MRGGGAGKIRYFHGQAVLSQNVSPRKRRHGLPKHMQCSAGNAVQAMKSNKFLLTKITVF